jgi:hypothetical protein
MFLFVCFFGFVATAQTTRYVDLAGQCGGNTPCYTTIQAAINASANGDTIEVSEGTYIHTTQLNISKEVTLRSANSNTNRPVIRFTTYTSWSNCQMQVGAHNVVIDGFEIDGGGQASARYILGDWNSARNNWTVRNCKIYNGDNGLRIVGNSITIEDNDIGLTRGDCINGEYGLCGGLKVTRNILHAESNDWSRKPAGITYNVDATTVGDVEISYNYVYASRTFIDFQHNGGTAPANNILIMHNTVDWRMEDLPSPVPAGAPGQQMSIAFWTNGGRIWDATKFEIRDNIFSRQKWYMILNTSGSQGPIVGNMEIKNNLFYQWYMVDDYFPAYQYPKEWPGVRGAAGWATTDDDFLFTDNVLADPLYSSSGSTPNEYYSLLPGSPANKAASDGTNIGAWQSPVVLWEGTIDSDWNNPANWSDNSVPQAATDIEIPVLVSSNYPVISNYAASCNDMTIIENASLTIDATGWLTVSGALNNFAGVSGLVINAGAAGSGSLIQASSNVEATIGRYLPGDLRTWHMISSPVISQPIQGGDFEPGENDDLYLWHEPSPGIWVNYTNQDGSGGSPTFPQANNGNNNLAVGRGYIANYNEVNPVKYFRGTLNAGEIDIPLAVSGLKSWDWESGWNLVGNPYVSSIDWNLVDKTDLAELHAQVYDPAFGGGGYRQVTTIAPQQGFFIRAAVNGANLNLTNFVQTHGGTFYKSNEDKQNDELVIRLSKDHYFDETKIVINEMASNEYDFYDATKLFSFNEQVPQIFSKSTDGRWLSVNSIPTIKEPVVIPLTVNPADNGLMSLTVNELTGGFSEKMVFLLDKKNDAYHNLSLIPTYSFTSFKNDDPDRFELLIDNNKFLEPSQTGNMKVFTYQDVFYLINHYEKANVEIFDLNGRLMLKKEIDEGFRYLKPMLSTGTYIVRMISGNEILNRKVFLGK